MVESRHGLRHANQALTGGCPAIGHSDVKSPVPAEEYRAAGCRPVAYGLDMGLRLKNLLK